jgi:osmoprotectant transport system permease protein
MIAYWINYHDRLLAALRGHLAILGITLFFSILLASAITVLILPHKRAALWALSLFGAVYSIPSLALFAILIPILGIGMKTAVTVLVLYNQFLLIRNFLAGFNSIDPVITEAALGMGMTGMQMLGRIKLPLAFPALMAGVRLAVISTIGIATIASVINAGGIGVILFDGLRTLNAVKILWGTILSGGLAVAANAILGGIERFAAARLHYRDPNAELL